MSNESSQGGPEQVTVQTNVPNSIQYMALAEKPVVLTLSWREDFGNTTILKIEATRLGVNILKSILATKQDAGITLETELDCVAQRAAKEEAAAGLGYDTKVMERPLEFKVTRLNPAVHTVVPLRD